MERGELIGFGVGGGDELLDTRVAGLRQQRLEIPDDVVGGQIGGGHIASLFIRVSDATAPRARCITNERAVNPASLEEILGLAVAGERGRVDADATGIDAEREQLFYQQLPHPDRPRLRLHEDLVDDAEPGAVAQYLVAGDAVADHESSVVPTTTNVSSRAG